jgi:excinuclease UvrABC nuclease subunit
MKVEKLNPLPTEKVSFTLSSYKQVPKLQGCYILSTYDNIILYIGLATNLSNRFRQHLDNPEKTNPTADGKAIWFHYTTFDPLNLPKLERTWINQFLSVHGRFPILNKTSPPIS